MGFISVEKEDNESFYSGKEVKSKYIFYNDLYLFD